VVPQNIGVISYPLSACFAIRKRHLKDAIAREEGIGWVVQRAAFAHQSQRQKRAFVCRFREVGEVEFVRQREPMVFSRLVQL
jgi:hypothetical protein